MIDGKKLKELRLLRSLTQKELAIKSGLTDAAIRNYELGNRSPNKEQLDKIAEALKCHPSALIDHNLFTYIDIYQIIFDLEDYYRFRPVVEGGSRFLLSIDSDFDNFLVEWDEMRKKHYNGEITDDEFRDWKLSYPKKSRFLK